MTDAPADMPIIDCPKHGRERVALVCQHIAETLVTREPVGFFWSRSDASELPDAWCGACHDRHVRADLEWTGAALENLGVQLLCASCYFEARRLCLGD